ncbi:MAG: hypothetical protein ABIP66_10380 [Gemmatimonadaceae bacterium]
MLPLDRHGFAEECYFLFSYSPIRLESGEVGGVLVTVNETTQRILGERRLKTTQALAARNARSPHGGRARFASTRARSRRWRCRDTETSGRSDPSHVSRLSRW